MSKNTKTRTLESALGLFNELGLAKVTLRTIAKAMNISQGNLNYHFKKREDILEALYYQLVAKMNESVVGMQQTIEEFGLSHILDQSKKMMENFYAYRFFMLDFVQIMRENKRINAHYRQLCQLRERQFTGMFDLLIHKGLMRQEEFDNEYHNLYLRTNILADFWLSSAIIHQEITLKTVDKYCEVIFQNIYPYLTSEGKEGFLVLVSK